MNNMKPIYKISGIVVLLIFILGLALSGCTTQSKTADETTTSQTEATAAAETTVVETQATEQLSEQPDKAKYDEYFTDFYLGKLPKGTQFGPYLGGTQFDQNNMPVKTAVFIASEDEFCGVGTLKKDIPQGNLYISVYDAEAKKDAITKAPFPQGLNAGDFGWADDPINFPAGKYEYKLYIDDVLAVVIPFEVH